MRGRKTGAVLLTGAVGVVSLVAAPAASAEPHCASGWRFTSVKRLRTGLDVTERLRAENPTNKAQTVTFTSKKSKTRGWKMDARVEGETNAIFASVKVSVGGGIERSSTAESGISVTATVPPRSYVIGRYGVFMRRYSGRLKFGTSSNSCGYDRRRLVRAPSGSTGWRVTSYKLK
jgi:hypothetical protein